MAELPPMMYVTTDAVGFSLGAGGRLRVLLIRRANDPYRGRWALPGGFVDEGEDLPDACARELHEETGLRPTAMAQIGAWGTPGRDPRGRNVTVAYLAAMRPGETNAVAGDDAARAAWHPADELPPLAFDHADILATGRRKLARICRRTHFIFALLPELWSREQLEGALTACDVAGDAEEVRALTDAARVEPTGDGRFRCMAGFLEPLGQGG